MCVCVCCSPLHEVPEEVDDLLLQSRAVLDDGVAFVGDLLLQLLQLTDLLPDLQLRLRQRREPERAREKGRKREKERESYECIISVREEKCKSFITAR